MNLNETYYRRVISAIGFSLLIFLALIELFGVFVTGFVSLMLELLFVSRPVAETVTYQVIFAAGYLFCFMIPVAFLRIFIRKAGYTYQPMYSPARISPWLPLIVLSGVTLIFSAAYLGSYFMDLIGYSTEGIVSAVERSADPKIYDLVLEFLVVCLVPGFCEEFLFRGAILANCLPFGKGRAILISALLFSIMHRNAEQIFYAFVAGILLGILYVKTENIWNCVILHTVNNFISITQVTVVARVKDGLLAMTYVSLLELLIFSLGIVSTVILILKFFSKKDTKIKNGIFGKELPAVGSYASCGIEPRRAFRLFWTPSMIVFLSLCVVELLLLIVIVLWGGNLLGTLG